MASVDLSTYDPLLKEVYLPPIQELLASKRILLRHIGDGDPSRFQGLQVHIPVHTGRTAGIGARAEAGSVIQCHGCRAVDPQRHC